MHTLFLMYIPEGAQIIWIGIIAAILLLPFIFYLLTLQSTLKLVAPNNRKMPPGQVWLTLIPIFGTVWHFFVVNNVSMSIEKEFRSRGLPIESKPAYTIGLIACILYALSTVLFLLGDGSKLASLAAFICLIIYWVKIAGHKNKLLMSQYNKSIPEENNSYFTK